MALTPSACTIMVTASCMRMAEAADRLRLAQWLSPAFPIGGFAYSQGLETAMVNGQVLDAASLTDWLQAVLTHGTARSEAVLLLHARQPDADLALLTDLCLAYAPSYERTVEMMEQGRAFGQTITAITGEAQPPLPLPLAVGYATRALVLPDAEVLALWLHGVAAQLVSAAVRFVPLGQSQGQAVLAKLAETVTNLARMAISVPLADLGGCTPGADLAAIRHETLHVRIFRT